ncbi:MAG: hypothetical protein GX591_00610 [Planctomycetes bacterium]|nr:hypothetical protein [Planctomycetota bacterium]
MTTTVEVTELADYQGQPTFRIATPSATWYYHKAGAGFASLVDPEGRDWISFRPTGGSDGRYRGIPNLVHPAGYFHPGGDACQSRLVEADDGRAVIESTAEDGRWAVRWEITTLWAHLTVRAAPEPYWFLYEGTPGGKLDETNDFCLRSRGIRTTVGQSWDEVLAHPKWVAFGSPAAGRALVLVHHDGGDEADSYWPMQHNMTVLGFGRRKLDSFLTGTDRRFTVQLIGAALDDAIHASVTAALSVPEA